MHDPSLLLYIIFVFVNLGYHPRSMKPFQVTNERSWTARIVSCGRRQTQVVGFNILRHPFQQCQIYVSLALLALF